MDNNKKLLFTHRKCRFIIKVKSTVPEKNPLERFSMGFPFEGASNVVINNVPTRGVLC